MGNLYLTYREGFPQDLKSPFLEYPDGSLITYEELEEIHDFFKSTEEFSFDEARQEFEEDEFTDDEIRILRIDFISKVGN